MLERCGNCAELSLGSSCHFSFCQLWLWWQLSTELRRSEWEDLMADSPLESEPGLERNLNKRKKRHTGGAVICEVTHWPLCFHWPCCVCAAPFHPFQPILCCLNCWKYLILQATCFHRFLVGHHTLPIDLPSSFLNSNWCDSIHIIFLVALCLVYIYIPMCYKRVLEDPLLFAVFPKCTPCCKQLLLLFLCPLTAARSSFFPITAFSHVVTFAVSAQWLVWCWLLLFLSLCQLSCAVLIKSALVMPSVSWCPCACLVHIW